MMSPAGGTSYSDSSLSSMQEASSVVVSTLASHLRSQTELVLCLPPASPHELVPTEPVGLPAALDVCSSVPPGPFACMQSFVRSVGNMPLNEKVLFGAVFNTMSNGVMACVQ